MTLTASDIRAQYRKCGMPLPPALAPTPTPARRAKRGTGERAVAKRQSALEMRFVERWTLLGGPELVREYRAVPGRRFRFDFAHVASGTLIEIHGGVFSGGRHTNGMGFVRDREKMKLARRLGWVVEELTEKNMQAVEIEQLIRDVQERAAVEQRKPTTEKE